jgi:Phage integrase family
VNWRLCKTYGRLIGVPELKPHDLRHGVAMEVLEQHHDLEQVRALLGHTRIDTTQIYATIRPAQLKRSRVLRGQGRAHVERIKPLFESRSATGTFVRAWRGGEKRTWSFADENASNISAF